MPSIAVVGAGAIGAIIAARLTLREGNDLVVATRTPFADIEIVHVTGVLRATVPVITDPAAADGVDWVLVATKAYDAEAAAAWFPALVRDGTRVAILQNGVEHRERFDGHLAAERIVPVIVDIPAERQAPGRVTQRGSADLVVGASAPGRDFAALFDGTGVDVTVSDDFNTAAWRKLCLNAAGAISTALLKQVGPHDHAAIELARRVVTETVAVGRAEGATLEDSLVDTLTAGMRGTGAGVNSLHADRLAGRPMELDARNGAVVRFGERHGIPTPANRMLVDFLSTAGPGQILELES